MVELRDYQTTMRDGILAALVEHPGVLGVLPTGGGKGVIIGDLTALWCDMCPEDRILIAAPTDELVDQLAEKLTAFGLTFGYLTGKKPMHLTCPIQIGTVACIATRQQRIGRFALLIADEAHHCRAKTWEDTLALADMVVGFTATPVRHDGKGLGRKVGGWFDVMVEGPDVAWLTSNGYLCPSTVFGPQPPDMSKVRMLGGDYNVAENGRVMCCEARLQEVVETYTTQAKGLTAMAFCVSIDHAEVLAKRFVAAGYRAMAVSSDTTASMRETAMRQFCAGTLDVLCNCQLFGEGVDVPDMRVVIMARPTASKAVYRQQGGRGLRPAPGKEKLLILDHAGNTQRHGLLTDAIRWELDAEKKPGQPGEAPTKQCLVCSAWVSAQARTCDNCGTEFPVPQIPQAAQRTLVQHQSSIRWTVSAKGNPTAKLKTGLRLVISPQFRGGFAGMALDRDNKWKTMSRAATISAVKLELEDLLT